MLTGAVLISDVAAPETIPTAVTFAAGLPVTTSITIILDPASFLAACLTISDIAASNLEPVILLVSFATSLTISSVVGGFITCVDFLLDFATADVCVFFEPDLVFSNTMSLIFESSIVVVIDNMPLEVSTSYFLISFAPGVFVWSIAVVSVSLIDFLGSVAVFFVVFVCVVEVSLRMVDEDDCETGAAITFKHKNQFRKSIIQCEQIS